jgi:hypothetical protein
MGAANIHEEALWRSIQIAKFQVECQFGRRFLSPLDVIRVLNQHKISFVLVGTYGCAGWREARATEDIDVVIALRQVKKATGFLLKKFSFLEAEDQEVFVHLKDKESKRSLIDLVKPVSLHLHAVFKYTKTVELKNQTYRIPSCEMALVLKFAPLISPTRDYARKFQNAADFMIMAKRNSDIDLDTLKKLGDLVYNGGGKEIVEMVRKVRAGEKLVL